MRPGNLGATQEARMGDGSSGMRAALVVKVPLEGRGPFEAPLPGVSLNTDTEHLQLQMCLES